MDDQFHIYVEQLRKGRDRKIDESLDPAFLDIHEAELSCEAPVHIEGEAYLADNDLIVHLNRAKTEVLIPCCICNEPVTVPIEIQDFYHSEPLEQIPTGIYNFKE